MIRKTLVDFIRYHNATPLILVAVLLVAGITLAASPKGKEVLFSDAVVVTDTSPTLLDSTALQKTDLKKLDQGLRIDAILEDAGSFIVRYSYRTFEIHENTWKPLTKSKELKVDKKFLGNRDLGIYLADQIGQVMDQEVAYLIEVQNTFKQGPGHQSSSQYTALIGKELDSNSKEFVGYQPVVQAPSKPIPSLVAPMTEEQSAARESIRVMDEQTSTEVLLSKKEIRDIIVSAVADFLAIEAASPTPPTLLPTTLIDQSLVPALSDSEVPSTEEESISETTN